MKVWIVVLKVFGYVWVTTGVIAILIGIGGTWMKGGLQELMSPFNVVN